MSLTPQQEAFVAAYVATFNATESARRCGYDAPERAGSRLCANVGVRLAIQRAIRRAQAQEGILQPAEILRRLQAAAFCDPGELTSVRVRCCRHCHGEGFEYQWRSEQEWAEAIERAIAEHESRLKSWRRRQESATDIEPEPRLDLPSSRGGFDFDPRLLPVDECPKCDGDGEREVLLADTRFLSPEARMLFAGVKQTKDGIEIKLHDQLKMRELLMRHHGMLNDKLIHLTPGGAGALGVEPGELAQLEDHELAALEGVHAKLMASRAQKALAAPERPPQHGEISDA